MTEPIDFNGRPNPDLADQLTYLIRREFYVSYFGFRFIPLYLVGATLAMVGLIVFTSHESLIILKAVLLAMMALAWVIAIVFGLAILLKWLRRYRWKQKSLQYSKSGYSDMKLFFDNQNITIIYPTVKNEISWEYYKFWTEHKNSIFLFPETNLYEALYYSVYDLGNDNYLEFKKLASSKLTPLNDSKESKKS